MRAEFKFEPETIFTLLSIVALTLTFGFYRYCFLQNMLFTGYWNQSVKNKQMLIYFLSLNKDGKLLGKFFFPPQKHEFYC